MSKAWNFSIGVAMHKAGADPAVVNAQEWVGRNSALVTAEYDRVISAGIFNDTTNYD